LFELADRRLGLRDARFERVDSLLPRLRFPRPLARLGISAFLLFVRRRRSRIGRLRRERRRGDAFRPSCLAFRPSRLTFPPFLLHFPPSLLPPPSFPPSRLPAFRGSPQHPPGGKEPLCKPRGTAPPCRCRPR